MDFIGKYKILSVLGRGGMGEVYKAYDQRLNRVVAVKVILTEQKNDKNIKRFTREAKTIATLNHPNIVKIFDIGFAQQVYFAMSFIEGVSLKQFIKQKPCNIPLYTRLMIKIARAMSYAHSCHVIHRDLKPGNILIDKSLEPQVMDFGLAKFAHFQESISNQGEIMGTPAYMSPEQVKAHPLNHLSDIYSLGAIFYEMLAGVPMIKGENIHNIIFKITHQEVTSLRDINPLIAFDLEAICHKAVAKKKAQRYQSADAFADDLEKFLKGEFISTPGIYRYSWQKIKKYKFICIVFVSIFFFTSIAITFNTLYQNKKRRQKIHAYLQKSQDVLKNKKSLASYITASQYLVKALDVAPDNNDLVTKFIEHQEKMGHLALSLKEYFLVQISIKKIAALGDFERSKKLEKLMSTKLKKSQKKHKKFIKRAMSNAKPDLFEWYVFKIARVAKPYVVKELIPYLYSTNKWQRTLTIFCLGKLRNRYTKVNGKDSVAHLLELLKKSKDKKEMEDLIHALGWLKDARANELVYDIRWQMGEDSIFWQKTKIAYSRLPVKKEAKSVDEFFDRGQMKCLKGNYKGAIADFSKVIEMNPRLVSAYNNRGIVYREQGLMNKAIADFSKAIELNPAFVEGYNNRGNVYGLLRKLNKAMADFNKAIVLNPRHMTAYNNRGGIRKDQGDVVGAIADYTRAIALAPDYAETYSNRGNAYRLLGNFPKAIADLNKAIAINPNLPEAHSDLGIVYHVQGQYKRSIASYDRAIYVNPKYAKAYSNRGLLYHTLGDLQKAMKDYNQAIAIDANLAEGYANRGVLYAYQKNLEKALKDYNKAIAINPTSARIYTNRGNVRKNLGDITGAIKDHNKAIAIDPKLAKAYVNRGNVYLYLKNFTAAIKDQSKAIAINPGDAQAYVNRAVVREKQGDLVGAIADHSLAIKNNPKFPMAYGARGMIYFRLKKRQKAYKDFQIFLKLAPNYPQAFYIRNILQKYYSK